MPEIFIIGSMKARPGKEAATREALEALAVATHAEDGCLEYSLHQGAEDPARFALLERWKSQEALDAHLTSGHFAAVLSIADELLSEPPDAPRYEKREPGSAGPSTMLRS